VYTHPRFLPATKVESCMIRNALLSEGCIVVGSELLPAVSAVRAQLGAGAWSSLRVDVDPEHAPVTLEVPSWSALAAAADDADPELSAEQRLTDLAAYIYTSGTTGLPKPALISHARMLRGGLAWSSFALNYRRSDVMYNCLPLYHSNGLILAAGSVVVAGVTLALARKFSRRQFWDDVRRHRATAFIYIGELCRYLLSAEPSSRDREHALRVITGNGLRPGIWPEFQRRFGIARISEFYGATEGNSVTVNVLNRVGSVGPMLPGMRLARWDEARQDFVRDERGFLVRAGRDEPGILLGRISRRDRFDGYRDGGETEKKVVRNAFAPGDAYFNTGDMLKRDRLLHLRFVDRLGDTFRWKGENVSTAEVEAELAKWLPAAEVGVYGVQVPGTEGRAGMAALVLGNGHAFDPASFKQHVDARLPAYARPLFARVQPTLAVTGTFKLKKADLQRAGFDPRGTTDPIYVRHPARDEYVRVDPELYQRLVAGELRF